MGNIYPAPYIPLYRSDTEYSVKPNVEQGVKLGCFNSSRVKMMFQHQLTLTTLICSAYYHVDHNQQFPCCAKLSIRKQPQAFQHEVIAEMGTITSVVGSQSCYHCVIMFPVHMNIESE